MGSGLPPPGPGLRPLPELGAAPLPVEIAFLAEEGVPPRDLRWAADEALLLGLPADEVLLRHGIVDEDRFYRALARALGSGFDPAPVLGGAAFPASILAGLAPLRHGRAAFVLAPQGAALRRLLAAPRGSPPPFVLTTPSALRHAVFRLQAPRIAHEAAFDFPQQRPDLSTHAGASLPQIVAATICAGLGTFCGTLVPSQMGVALAVGAMPLFCGLVGLRALAPLVPAPLVSDDPPALPEATLPVYTILVALHREGRIAGRLVQALAALDYPLAKLDIKLVIEADDAETREALKALTLPPTMQVIVAPPGSPRTKPRALNVALPLARGDLTVVYDAEDVPEPDQLRRAAASFARQPEAVVCLQARLTIDNTDDCWMTRFFTLEYAALFDVLNPALARWGLPVPLGGTSNHFRTAALRRIGGWDAWNVTEDADLGLRLARFGYRTADLPSSTFEEAPRTLSAWMRQRTRWLKGFMQTSITHSRHPGSLIRELGWRGAAGALGLTGGTVASALVYPVLTLASLRELGRPWMDDPVALLWQIGSVTVFGLGLLAMLAPALVAIRRRRLWRLLPFVPLLPVYYALVSVAAWRALWELVRSPYRWNKTDHGWATTSRRRPARPGSGDRAPRLPGRGSG